MMYRVIKRFLDLQDGSRPYEAGETFPRSGKTVSEARLTELSTSKNRQGTPLIELVAEEPTQEAEPETAPEEAPEVEAAPESPKKKGRKK